LKPILLAAVAIVAACRTQSQVTPVPDAHQVTSPADPSKRQAWFGDTHLHTSFSFDAWAKYGSKITPDEAYRFGQGETVTYLGRPAKRAHPLDFMAVTDHSEYMGAMNQLDDPTSAASLSAFGRQYRSDGKGAMAAVVEANKRHVEIPGMNAATALRSTWQMQIDAANKNYRPGKFTTFIGYEWTSMWEGRYNLHRNVLFSGDDAPVPFTSQDSERPQDLWSYLETQRARGFEAIAIPHNSNASGGLMFGWNDVEGRPIDEAYAQRQLLNEPLAEIYQSKGQSETHPDLSGADEFADFEVFDQLLMAGFVRSEPRGSYLRDAWGRGLVIGRKVGTNPYRFGVVGGNDFHNGLSTSAEDAYGGNADGIDPSSGMVDVTRASQVLTPRSALSNLDLTMKGSGGLTGVWAEENTRPSIFAAFRRRETFATSGTRIKLRLFAGWSYDRALLSTPDWTRTAYRDGVPMGGDLAAPAAGVRRAPRFALQAVKDPDGANLDRIQIIKVWLDGDGYREQVYDVAWSGGRKRDRRGRVTAVGDTVDLKTGAYANTIGAAQLQTVWSDPDFDPAKPAVYYMRVLEIPTPRWSTLLAIARGLPILKGRPASIQERGWSSPIWYAPRRR
jgi:hypothetical protein